MNRRADNKTQAWILDADGRTQDGWLETIEEDGQLRPADSGWSIVAVFPPEATPARATRVVLWADNRDKYIARLDIGHIHRWVVCERLPALLRTLEAFNALVDIGRP